MTLTWTDITNGLSNLLVRTGINTFNNNVVTQVNQNTGDISTNAAAIGVNTSDIATNTSNIATNTSNIATNTSNISGLDTRVTALEGHHTLLLTNFSTVDQNPTGLGDVNKIQLVFDSSVSVTDVSIASTGVVTFNTTGKYFMRFEAHYGRLGSTGASVIAYRIKYNGIVTDELHVAKLDNADIIVPFVGTYIFDATAGDYATMEIMRDSSGDNSGGILTTSTDWGVAPSCRVEVYRVG